MTEIKDTAKNMEEVRELNLSLVIKILHKLKICSRAEIAEKSGLKQSTITNIVNILIDGGLVRETGSINGKKGRRSIGITLTTDLFRVIGIRLTRTSFSVGCFDIEGKSHEIVRREFPAECIVDDILVDMERVVNIVIQNAKSKVVAIGFAVPGPFLARDSRILLITGARGWEKVNFKEYFASKFNIPVFIEHDANAGVLAEWWYGKNNLEHGVYIYVAAGYGLGAGIIIDGKVLHGSMGIAGEIGHMGIDYNGPLCTCGNRGCLEMYSSTQAIMQYIFEQLQLGRESILTNQSNFDMALDAYFSGDFLAREAFSRCAKYLGIGLVNLINMYNPDIIILGDELMRAGEDFLQSVKQTIKSHLLPELYEGTSICLSSFECDPALIGAGALSIDNCLQKPSELLECTAKQQG